MDCLNPYQRHKAMLANSSKDTKIEILLRKALWHEGIRYRKNYKVCSCHPDIVITKYKIAVFAMVSFGMVCVILVIVPSSGTKNQA